MSALLTVPLRQAWLSLTRYNSWWRNYASEEYAVMPHIEMIHYDSLYSGASFCRFIHRGHEQDPWCYMDAVTGNGPRFERNAQVKRAATNILLQTNISGADINSRCLLEEGTWHFLRNWATDELIFQYVKTICIQYTYLQRNFTYTWPLYLFHNYNIVACRAVTM